VIKIIFYAPFTYRCCEQYSSEELATAGTDYKMFSVPTGKDIRVTRIFASNPNGAKAKVELYSGNPSSGGTLKLKITIKANSSFSLENTALEFENDVYAKSTLDGVFLLLTAIYLPE